MSPQSRRRDCTHSRNCASRTSTGCGGSVVWQADKRNIIPPHKKRRIIFSLDDERVGATPLDNDVYCIYLQDAEAVVSNLSIQILRTSTPRRLQVPIGFRCNYWRCTSSPRVQGRGAHRACGRHPSRRQAIGPRDPAERAPKLRLLERADAFQGRRWRRQAGAGGEVTAHDDGDVRRVGHDALG